MNKIRILVVAPNEEPYQLKIPHTLKEMQKVVGGLVEYVQLEHNVDLICNDEGKLLNLELNRVLGNDVIAGTFFIAGQHKGETISLSRKQIKKYKRIFRLEKDKHFIDYLKTRKVMPEDLVRLVIRKTKAHILVLTNKCTKPIKRYAEIFKIDLNYVFVRNKYR